MSPLRTVAWLLAAAWLLGACQGTQNPFALRDIHSLMRPLAFQLRDGDGRTVTEADFAGRIQLLYFGYTHCPDICPATLAELSAIVRRLGDDAGRVKILFVSVDPARDTPAVLKEYARAFGPQVVGLSGDQGQLMDLTKRYRISYGLGKPDAKGRYEVSHSSAVFIFDAQGAARLLFTQEDDPAALAADLRRLLKEG